MMSDDETDGQSVGLPVAALAGVGCMPAKGDDAQEEARVFYVAARRAVQRLVIGLDGVAGLDDGQARITGLSMVQIPLLHI